MKKKLSTILLLDDNAATNFIHKKFIKETECAERILDFQSGFNALDYLKSESGVPPELIFVDINMPIMSAWEFLEEYRPIKERKGKETVVLLLSTSLSPSDQEKAKEHGIIDGIRLKPLNTDTLREVIGEYFPGLS